MSRTSAALLASALCCALALPAGAQPTRNAPAPPVTQPSAPQAMRTLPLTVEGEELENLTRVTSEPMAYWPAVAADESFMVYVVRGEGEGSDLALKRNLAGSAVTRLTAFPGVEKQPAVSADGKFVAYSGNQRGTFDIYVVSAAGGIARRLVTDGPQDEEFPDWSPDGRLLAYSARAADGRWSIWVADLQTGAQTQYVEGIYPRFSPDGKKLLFQQPAGKEGLFALWTIDLEGVALTQISPPAPEWGAIQPRWSPDGRQIAFCSVMGDAARNYTVRQPDGSFRAVALTGNTHLWVMAADGNGLTQLTRHVADDWYPFWVRSGALLFTTTRDGAMRIWKFDLPPVGLPMPAEEVEQAPVVEPEPGTVAPPPPAPNKKPRPAKAGASL